MLKRHSMIALFLVLALLLSGCGSAAAPAGNLAEAPAGTGGTAGTYERLPDEAYEAVDYALYPNPEGGYVGDVMPFVTDDGTLELYYLYDTDHNGQGYHPIYKYSTKNLYEYKDHGMVLNFGQMSDPDPALGTGSVLQDPDGLYHLFYTGHTSLGNSGQGTECVMHASSTDRENWVKDGVLFNAPEGYSSVDFRDPAVFWDTWYLTYSWDCVTYYAMSDSMDGPFVAPRDNLLDGKGMTEGNGFIFYAAKTAEIDCKTYLCGWLGRMGMSSDSGMYQWAGSVMNHELVQREDKTLGVKAPDIFAEYFTMDKIVPAVPLTDGVAIDGSSITLTPAEESYAQADMGTRPATMTLECDVRFDGEGVVGFTFGGSDRDETWTTLCLDGRQNLLHYEGYEIEDLRSLEPMAVTKFDFSRSNTHHVKLVCENEIVVLYIDDYKALSSRITHSIDGAHIGVFAEGCEASFDTKSR